MAFGKYINSIIAILVITGKVVDFPTASPSFIWGVLAIAIAVNYRQLKVIWKTLPRDIKGISRLIRGYKKFQECQNNGLTFLDLFRCNLDKHPEKTIIHFEDQKWSFADLEQYSNQVAHVFQKRGYKKGDVIALIMGNCPEYVGIWFGLAKLGVVTALLNTNIRGKSLVHSLRVAKARAIVYSSDFKTVVDEISPDISDLVRVSFEDETDELRTASKLAPIPAGEITIRDHVFYIYTSGTTGLPKAAIIPHHRFIMIAVAGFYLFNLRRDEVVYNPLPLYHTAGGVLGIAGPICFGYTTVIRRKFSASQYWPDCIKYGCTVAQYIGEMCRYVLMVPPKPEDKQHKVRFIFGNGMKTALWRPFVERFNLQMICELYGSTEGNTNLANIDETVGAVGFLPSIIPAMFLPIQLIKVTEAGEPIRNKNGYCERCKPGEPGMIIGMIEKKDLSREFNGYVGNQVETSKKIIEHVFKKGDRAFLSGDILVMDELGYLYFKDRTGDTFRWKGENVSTTEVEEAITSVVGLRDVTVYGVEVPNNEGRAGMATIVDHNDQLDLEALGQALDKALPSYARPQFLRVAKQMENMTGTFKLKKIDLQKEGFNPDIIKDKLFCKHFSKGYIELTKEVYNDILSGNCRF